MQRIYVTIRPLNREDSVLYFPPEAFGPFRVLHQIGAGTLGPVFRAYEPGHDRLVAVKVFRLDLTPEHAAALVAELEAVVAADIHHPNIAAPIAAGLEHGAAYLAQEYAVGDSIDVVLRERGPMPVRDVVALVQALASAIDHAADRGVHHGLLHPRDIVVGADTVRITGFGIAAALSKVGAKLPTRPQYSAPDEPPDAYAVHAIAFEMATGKRATPDSVKAFEAAPVELHEPVEPHEPHEPYEPHEPIHDPLDRVIDLGARPELELDEPALPPPPFPTSWAAQPPRALQTSDVEPELPRRRWSIVAMFLVFAVLAALSVGFFLRSPNAVPVTDKEQGVDSTIVDLPAAPAPGTSASAPTEPAALRRDTPGAPTAPATPIAPSPSRPASGAVRRAQTGSVLVRSTPADADVLVNGKPRGKTPLALRDLALGSYTIRVARDGYIAEQRTLQLTPRRPTASTTITLRSAAAMAKTTGPGVLSVQSRPAGARVFVNNRLAGSTPIAIPGLPAGSATVRIELDGYLPWTTTVGIGAGEQTRVAGSLERK